MIVFQIKFIQYNNYIIGRITVTSNIYIIGRITVINFNYIIGGVIVTNNRGFATVEYAAQLTMR